MTIAKVVKKKEKFFIKGVNKVYSTGRRKEASARVWVAPGSGKYFINKKNASEYFNSFDSVKYVLIAPMRALGLEENKYDVFCTVKGGGTTGQSEAIRHGLSRAMAKPNGVENAETKKILRDAGLITRDARVVERKKYGLRKARKRPQFSKR